MKLKTKKYNSEHNKSSTSNVFHFKKDVETVLKLSFSPNKENELSHFQNNNSLSQNKSIFSNKHIDSNSINLTISEEQNNDNSENKYEKELNKFTHSLKQLKTYYPNNTDLIELEKSAGVKIPTRIEHLKTENKLKQKILSYQTEEQNINNKKDIIQKELFDLEKRILDLELSLEVVVGFEKENNNKVIRDKLISKFEKEYIKNDENKLKKKNISNSKEFQDELDLFLQRQEYNTKIKAKEIENDIIINKNKKKEIIEKLNGVMENLRIIHKNKNFNIDKLYKHYLNLLHDGKDTRNEGLCWIIREIFSLDKKVMLSYMPEFLDKLCIKYLFNMTHLNIEISGVENEIKSFKNEFKKVSIINNGDDFLKRKNLIQKKQNNLSNEYLNEKNEVMGEYLDKIRKTFCKNSNVNRNIKFKNSQSYIKKNQNKTNINNPNNSNKKISFKKKKTVYLLPFINGDPNSQKKTNKEIAYTNKLLKEELNSNIPNILRVKDLEQMTKDNGYFLNGDEIQKVKNYLNLNKKLNNLRKKKEDMKLEEMNRIFKEFQRNDYAEKFNIDKVTVISALIGEDNLNSEMVKQSKREKKYIEEIMMGRMHKKITGKEKSHSVKNLYNSTKYNYTNNNFKNMTGFENFKNIENNANDKRFNSFGNI